MKEALSVEIEKNIKFNMSADDWYYALSNGIIDAEDVRAKIEMNKRKEILEAHKYNIWQGDNGSWYTYVPDNTKFKNRRLIRKSTREKLENYLLQFYGSEDVPTFESVYNMWRNVENQMVTGNTVAKYKTDYNRFFKDTAFSSTDIRKIDEDVIRVFMCKTIERCKLQKEPMRKLFGYIAGTFRYARKKKIISENPTEMLESKDFIRFCYERPFVPDSKKTISDENMRLLQERFREDYKTHPDYITTYAVEFASLTGMRVSEISALRWDCITEDYIVIDSSEKSDPQKHVFWIDRTKNGKIRTFPMTDKIRELLNQVEQAEKTYGYYCEWVFADANGRIHAPAISSCAKAKARQVGLPDKGFCIHAYRKTLNSKMRNKGLSAAAAASILGHDKMTNENYYTFDVEKDDTKARIVEEINNETLAFAE